MASLMITFPDSERDNVLRTLKANKSISIDRFQLLADSDIPEAIKNEMIARVNNIDENDLMDWEDFKKELYTEINSIKSHNGKKI